MPLAVALLPLLALHAAARDPAIKDLALGDRVEITFHSTATITGTLVAPPGQPKGESIDYGRAAALTIDLSWEYPGLTGTMTVEKKEIRSVRKLRLLNEKETADLVQIKKRLAQANAKPAAPKPATPAAALEPAPAPKPEPAKPDDAAVKAEQELKKALEIFAKFPPPDWSPERYNAIRIKRVRGQVPTPTEREFFDGFSLWEKGKAAAEKKPVEPKK
jgi:hypothetical protein